MGLNMKLKKRLKNGLAKVPQFVSLINTLKLRDVGMNKPQIDIQALNIKERKINFINIMSARLNIEEQVVKRFKY